MVIIGFSFNENQEIPAIAEFPPLIAYEEKVLTSNIQCKKDRIFLRNIRAKDLIRAELCTCNYPAFENATVVVYDNRVFAQAKSNKICFQNEHRVRHSVLWERLDRTICLLDQKDVVDMIEDYYKLFEKTFGACVDSFELKL
jgi:hypothetical protein